MPDKNNLDSLKTKLQSIDSAEKTVRNWQDLGFNVVFTNGCFDLLHYGHLHYLAEAADLADYLVIGLNSDASVKRLKGNRRPIKDELSRATFLAALSFVDLVVIFEDDTPLEVIKAVRPDILVKGGDWNVEDIIGSDLVMESGGEVLSLRFIEGYSTTNLETKILNQK